MILKQIFRFSFLLDSALVICVILGICPFYPSYLICQHNIVHNIPFKSSHFLYSWQCLLFSCLILVNFHFLLDQSQSSQRFIHFLDLFKYLFLLVCPCFSVFHFNDFHSDIYDIFLSFPMG